VLEHVKPVIAGDRQLEGLQGIVFEFDDVPAFGADHMVVVLPQMTMLIIDFAVVECVFLGKTEAAHQFEGFEDEIRLENHSLRLQQPGKTADGHMALGFQKPLQNPEPILEAIDLLLLEEFFELFFFLPVNLLHDRMLALYGAFCRQPR
jgi:hypothetical protein